MGEQLDRVLQVLGQIRNHSTPLNLMKLLEFIQRNALVNNCVIFKRLQVSFSKRTYSNGLRQRIAIFTLISSQWLSVKEQGIDDTCQTFEQPLCF